jgi:hercynylcysteine S-oxide lyase
LNFPITSNELIQKIERATMENEFRFAVFDHISSTPHMILPIKEIIGMMRRKGVPTLIDGAHAVGQVQLNLKNLDPDFYFSSI